MFTGKNIFFEKAGGEIDKKDGGYGAGQKDKDPLAGEQFVHQDIF